MNTRQKSKTSLILLIIALVILALTGSYFFYGQGLLKTAEVKDTDQVGQINNVADDNTISTVNNESTTSDQASRDPNRYYNDSGKFSYILPDEWKNKDLIFNVRPINKETDSGGPCGDANPRISNILNNSLAIKSTGSDFTEEFKKMFVGIHKAKILESDYGAKYATGIDICNGIPVTEEEIANAIRFRTVLYHDDVEISLVYSVDQNILKSQQIKINNLDKVAENLWNHKNTNTDIQSLYNLFEQVMITLKFENT